MGRYHVACPHCGLDRNQYLPSDSLTRVIKCPNCGRGVSARIIDDPNTTLVEKDGYIGVFAKEQEDDPKRRRKRNPL
jgi:phage terminase large subunit GpA-like protein